MSFNLAAACCARCAGRSAPRWRAQRLSLARHRRDNNITRVPLPVRVGLDRARRVPAGAPRPRASRRVDGNRLHHPPLHLLNLASTAGGRRARRADRSLQSNPAPRRPGSSGLNFRATSSSTTNSSKFTLSDPIQRRHEGHVLELARPPRGGGGGGCIFFQSVLQNHQSFRSLPFAARLLPRRSSFFWRQLATKFLARRPPRTRVHKAIITLDFFGEFVLPFLYFTVHFSVTPVEGRISRQ